MTEGTALLLTHHLHELKLGAMLRQYPSLVRQAQETGQGYEEFLLTLAETEINTRSEIGSSDGFGMPGFPCSRPSSSISMNLLPTLTGD